MRNITPNPITGRLPVNRRLLARVFGKIRVSAVHFHNGVPCWDWIGAIGHGGYAYFGGSAEFESQRAHRIIYQLFVEHIPDRKQKCDHLCRRRNCVNPAHIEVVTQRENTLRGEGFIAINAKKTHCVNGHRLAGDNLLIRVRPEKRYSDNPQRECRQCRKDASERYFLRKKGQLSMVAGGAS